MGCEPEMEISKLIPGWEQHVVCHVLPILTQHYTKIETAQMVSPLCVHNPGPKVIDVLFFCRCPLAFFPFLCLGCHQLSAAETHTLNMDEHHTFVNTCQYNDWLKFGKSWGEPFVNFKLHSFNVKCSQKLVNLGNPFLSSILIQKLPKTQKMSNLVGFTHVFDMEISLFLCYVLWPCLCTSKFYPKHFYPKFSKFFPVHTRKVEKVHTLCSRSWLYMFNYLLI